MNKPIDTIKIIIVDDHRLFNDGLCAIIKPDPSIKVLAQVYDSREAAEKVSLLNPDLVLADFNMPYINGIALTTLLLDKNARLKILILSMYNEERHIESFKKAGASGYLSKTVASEEVVTAIRKIYSGGYHFPEAPAITTHSDDDFLKKLKLSARELEVIRLIKDGLKTKEIAERLNISFYTAETHRKNIKLKMGLKGEADFIKFIFENF